MSALNDGYRDWLKKTGVDLGKLKRSIAQKVWDVEDLENSFLEQVKLQSNNKQSNTHKKDPPSRPRTTAARQSNARYVKEGVTRVVIEHDADGMMHAHIENIGLAVELKTSQRLRVVLLVLCGKISRVNDPDSGLVPYKTSAELREAIEEISGTPISATNLQNQIHFLRDRLQDASIDPKLIETGGGGYRFRLRMDGDVHEEK